jgi:hypothetical protein
VVPHPEDCDAIRRLVTNEPQLFDTFEEWLDAADERIEKFNPQEFTAWCSATNLGYDRATFLAFVIAASTKQ